MASQSWESYFLDLTHDPRDNSLNTETDIPSSLSVINIDNGVSLASKESGSVSQGFHMSPGYFDDISWDRSTAWDLDMTMLLDINKEKNSNVESQSESISLSSCHDTLGVSTEVRVHHASPTAMVTIRPDQPARYVGFNQA